MANRYWVGGTGQWTTAGTTVWAATMPLLISASCSGTALTTTGSPALVAGMTVRLRAGGTSLGTIVSGSGNAWVVSVGGTYATQDMVAATSGFSVPGTSDFVYFEYFTGVTVTIANTSNCSQLICENGWASTFAGSSGLTVSGAAFTLTSGTAWSATGLITFTGSPTVTTNTVTIGAPITYNLAGGTMTLGSALTLAATRTFTLTAGTLNLVSYTLTTGLFLSTSGLTRKISFGTGNITVNGPTSALWNTATTTGLTTDGTQVVNVSNNSAGATTITSGSLSEANSISFNFTTGTYSLSLTAGTKRNLNFTGFAGPVSNTAQTIYGNMILSNDMTLTGGANVWTLGGAVVSTRDVDLANKTALGFPLTFNASGSTFRFLRDTTLNTNYTWTAGNFDLNGFAITTTTLVTTGNSAVANGGRFEVTGSGTTVVNLSSTGASSDVPIRLTYTGSTGTRTISNFGNGGFSLEFTGAATDTVSFSGVATLRNLDTANFGGTMNFGGNINTYGSLNFNSNTVTGTSTRTLTLYGSATQYVLDATTTFPSFTGINVQPAANYKLNADVTVSEQIALIGNAALDLNGKTLTAQYGYSGLSGGNTPTITMSSGTIKLTGDITNTSGYVYVWDTTENTTFVGNGTISCTSALAKRIGPAGRTLPTIEQGGTGTLSLDDDGTGTGYVLADLTRKSTVTSATVIELQQLATTTFTNFSLSGTSSGQVTLRSGGSGTRATISKASGTVSTSYLTIQDIAATGGATWNAFTTNGNVDGGNNTGWNFSGGGTSVTVNVTGVEGVCSVGVGTVVANANAPPTGVSATATIDGVGVSAGGSISVDPNDVQGNGAIGSVTLTGKANVTLTAVSAAGSVGTATASIPTSVTLTGVGASGAVGTVTVSLATSVSVNVTGVEATGSVGTANATGKANTTLTGVQASGAVGTVTTVVGYLVTGVSATVTLGNVVISAGAKVSVTGVQATGYIGPVLVWSVINDNQTPNWQTIDDSQSVTWSAINDGQTPNWQTINDSQTVTWTQVNDGNTVTWVQIPT